MIHPRQIRNMRWTIVWGIAMVLTLFGAQHARAGGVVGDGTPASCTDAAYATAMTGGGTVTFDCGPNPVIIEVTTKVIDDITTMIDGGDKVTLDGGGNLQLFLVLSGGNLTLRNIHLTRGKFGLGGAIYSDTGASTTLVNVAVTSSEGDGANNKGGALYVEGGVVTVEDSEFSGNKAVNGGAVYVLDGSVTIRRTHLSNNTGTDGAAIFVNGGSLKLENSLVRRNTANDDGGGLYAAKGATTITNTTFFDNKADDGGGVNAEGTSKVNILNATITNNHADTAGGVWNLADNVTIKNTIIADSTNEAENADSLNCDGPSVTSQGHNLIGDGSCVSGGNATDLRNTDPKLGPFQDNGGNTFTQVPLSGSPAIDAGDNAGCPTNDQRGFPRPAGPACEIGAAEYVFLVHLPTITR